MHGPQTTFGALGHSLDACFESSRLPHQGAVRKRYVEALFERREGDVKAPTLAYTSLQAHSEDPAFAHYRCFRKQGGGGRQPLFRYWEPEEEERTTSSQKVLNPAPHLGVIQPESLLYDPVLLRKPYRRDGIGIPTSRYAFSLGQADLRYLPKLWLKQQHQRVRSDSRCSSLSYISALPSIDPHVRSPCAHPDLSRSNRKNESSMNFPLCNHTWRNQEGRSVYAHGASPGSDAQGVRSKSYKEEERLPQNPNACREVPTRGEKQHGKAATRTTTTRPTATTKYNNKRHSTPKRVSAGRSSQKSRCSHEISREFRARSVQQPSDSHTSCQLHTYNSDRSALTREVKRAIRNAYNRLIKTSS